MPNENAFLAKVRMEAHPNGAGNVAEGYLIPIGAKSMLGASWWYFVGRPARRAGRRPKHLPPFRRFLIASGISGRKELKGGYGEAIWRS
jgi:hypothetical protein